VRSKEACGRVESAGLFPNLRTADFLLRGHESGGGTEERGIDPSLLVSNGLAAVEEEVQVMVWHSSAGAEDVVEALKLCLAFRFVGTL
jgi:hypothetical protein